MKNLKANTPVEHIASTLTNWEGEDVNELREYLVNNYEGIGLTEAKAEALIDEFFDKFGAVSVPMNEDVFPVVEKYLTAQQVKAVETQVLLSPKTNRLFDYILENDFWSWVNNFYFKDRAEIIEDLGSFDEVNEAQKIIEILNELSYILKDLDVKNRAELNIILPELKTAFGYNQVYVLKTMVKLMIKLLNIDISDFKETEDIQEEQRQEVEPALYEETPMAANEN